MRIEQLTFTRFLAAVSVFLFHYGRSVYPFKSETVLFFIEQADVCVSYFFILSGFVMMVAYHGEKKIDPLVFYKKRFLTLYPATFLALLLVTISYATLRLLRTDDWMLNVLLLQSWVPGKALTLNFPAWSLSVELFFYITFPFLLNSVYKSINRYVLFGTALLLWFATQVLLNLNLPENYRDVLSVEKFEFLFYFPLMHLNEFILGNIAGLYFTTKLNGKKGNYDVHLAALFVLIVLAFRFPFGLVYNNGLLAVLFIPLIILLSLNTGFITRLFNTKLFVFSGKISFGIYIYQYPLLLWFSNERITRYLGISSPEIIFFLQLLALIMVAAISHTLIEKPIREKFLEKTNA